jgi:hypothetical protein
VPIVELLLAPQAEDVDADMDCFELLDALADELRGFRDFYLLAEAASEAP